MKDRKHVKLHHNLLFLLIILLCGCSKAPVEDINDLESVDGYKPVIMYQDSLYWLSVERPLTQLPKGFVDSQQRIKGCVDDAMQLPKEDLVVSAKGCGILGKNILANKEDEGRIIIAIGDNKFEVYERDQ